MVSHNGNIIIPRGMDRISYGDTVIVVTAADEPIAELNDIFETED